LLELTDSRVTLSVISIFLLSEIHTVVGMQVVLQGQVLNRYTDQAVQNLSQVITLLMRYVSSLHDIFWSISFLLTEQGLPTFSIPCRVSLNPYIL